MATQVEKDPAGFAQSLNSGDLSKAGAQIQQVVAEASKISPKNLMKFGKALIQNGLYYKKEPKPQTPNPKPQTP